MKAVQRLMLILMVACAAWGTLAMAADGDLDYQRLSASLDQLANDPILGPHAAADQALARSAVQLLLTTSAKDHAHVLYIAQRRVDTAKAAAQLENARQQLAQLQREHSKILVEASRRDAAATRRELERERLENMLAAEAAQKLQAQGEAYSQAAEQARAEAEQSRQLAQSQTEAAKLARREADLAEQAARAMRARMDAMRPSHGSKGMQMTLEGLAFDSGQAELKPDARAHMQKLVQFVQSKPAKHIRIEGHTDSVGSAAANRALSLQRAKSVRQALVASGVAANRISVVGAGAANPVASNASASGRARNRRVVVILQDH